jgi:hypothetical protein
MGATTEQLPLSPALTDYRRLISMWKLRRFPIVGSAARAQGRSVSPELLSEAEGVPETEEEIEPQRRS